MIYLRDGVAMLRAIPLEAAVHDPAPGEFLHGEIHGIWCDTPAAGQEPQP